LIEIDYNRIKRVVQVDSSGRIVADAEPVPADGWSTRGTFSGDAELS